jgi:type IV pilus assembly protein PilY1
LLNRTTARKIYTYFPAGGKKDLTDLSNAFTTANSSITLWVLGLAPTDPPDATKDQQKRNDLINYVHGYDAYKDESSDATKKRSWILGSFLHSRPFLHAFDDSDGRELWGFIPPNLLNKLQYLRTGEDVLFVDGSPKAYVTYDASNNVTSAILIFGERRGGNRYYALDVTDPETPKYLWDIGPDTQVGETFPYEKMGQSWSSPAIGKIACEGAGTCIGGKRTVAFIGGGYDDTNQDKEKPYTSDSDSKGTAVYVLDISDGSLIKRFSNAELPTMTYSIPSDITKVDLNGDGLVERLYVGDMGGRMWRFDIIGKDTSRWEGKIIFKSNPDGATTNLRKIFYPPDVTLELDDAGKGDFEMLFFGTGDREHPNDKDIVNRLYGLKDRNLRDKTLKTGYTEADLVDLTSDLLQDPTAKAEDKTKLLFDLKEKNGWYIALSTGEKSLAAPVVFYKTAYYTTFAPASDAPPPGTDPCYVGEGTAWVYAVNYQLGTAVFDFNQSTVLEKSDRSKQIGTAIPSGVIITIVNNEATAYVGVGGGVFSPRLPNRNSIIPVNWRIVF